MKNNKIIEVCDKCHRACCWYGEFMCDYADSAGTVKMTVSELKKLSLESPAYWSDKEMLEVYGLKAPYGYKK